MVASTSTTGSCSGKAPLPAIAEPPQAAALHAELRRLMASSRQRLAGAVNAELTRLGEQLAQAFGRGFEAKNLRCMVQFAQAFPQPEIVATLSRPLSWSRFVNLLPLKTEPARQFYAHGAAQDGWSLRELRQQIERAKPSSAPSLLPCKPPHPFRPGRSVPTSAPRVGQQARHKFSKPRTFWTFWTFWACASSKPSSWN